MHAPSKKLERNPSLVLPNEESTSAQHTVAIKSETGKRTSKPGDESREHNDILKRNKIAPSPMLDLKIEGNQVRHLNRQDMVVRKELSTDKKDKQDVQNNHSKKTS